MLDRNLRRALGVVVAFGVTALLLPVHAAAVFGFLVATERYDDSGQGGPFRSCTADSVSCSGPSPWLMVVCALAVVGCLALAGWLGQAVGRFEAANRARAGMAASSVLVVAAGIFLIR